MTFKNVIKTLTLLILTVSGSAMAQTAIITAGSAAVNAGDPATIDLTFDLNGTNSRSLQFDLTFDPVALPVVDASGCPAAGWTTTDGYIVAQCTDQGGGTWRMGWARIAGDVASGVVGTLVFNTLATAAPGDYALTISGIVTESGTGTPVNGTITLIPPPAPLFAASPASVTQSGQITNTIQTNVVIDNSGGEVDSILDYTCTETADPSNKFTISGTTTGSLTTAQTGTITVSCDSSAIGGPFTGTMSCVHNGSNTSPVDIPLSCTVNAGPEPAFDGVAAGFTMVATEQGDPDPTGTLTINNIGDATTTLTGTCTISGDPQISISNGGFSILQGDPAQVVGVTCDASVQGAYAATVSCSHNGTNTASPVTYPATCDVGPPGPAVYASTPAPGSTIEMTPGGDVPVGATVADQVLTITNDAAEANDADLELDCGWVGSADITVTLPVSPVSAQASTTATFSCSTANVGAYTGTFSCAYTDGNTLTGSADYTVNCGVRAASSEVQETPVSGTALSILVPILGTGQTGVNFSEALNEGIDGVVESCSFGTPIFSVVSTLPATVPAGGTIRIEVSGSDNGSGAITFTDTLTCLYSDANSDGTTVSWPITLTVLAQPIPTLSTWGLMLMILTLMGLGGIVIRRKLES